MATRVYSVVQDYTNLKFGHIAADKICLHSTEAGAVGCAFVKGRKAPAADLPPTGGV